MLAPLPLARARTVVEFGPGTGAITRALLDALPRQATLYSFEISPRFRDYLRQKLADPRLWFLPPGRWRGERQDFLSFFFCLRGCPPPPLSWGRRPSCLRGALALR